MISTTGRISGIVELPPNHRSLLVVFKSPDVRDLQRLQVLDQIALLLRSQI